MRPFQPRSRLIVAMLFLGAATISAACYRSSTKESTGDAEAATRLTDTEWHFVEVEGEPAGVGAGGKPATLMLATTDRRASGFAGCNRMTGGYVVEGSKLQFTKMAMTLMACAEGMELESRIGAVLEQTRGFKISGNTLELLAGETVVARLDRK